MLGRTDSRRRLLVVLVVFLVIGASLCSRLVWWQVVQHDQLAGKAQRQTTVRFDQPVRRGTIYDRTGTVVLATSVDRYLVAASPDQLSADRAARHRPRPGRDPRAWTPMPRRALSDKIETTKPYVVLTRGSRTTSPSRSGRDRRRHAQGDLGRARSRSGSIRRPAAPPARPWRPICSASSTATATASTGSRSATRPSWPGRLASCSPSVTSSGRPITDTAQVLSPGVAGSDLRLTIDTDLQLAAEQEVLAAYTADEAVSVSADRDGPRRPGRS